MYVIREVLNCKPGKVRQMVEKFQSHLNVAERNGARTDARAHRCHGRAFWTIVAEAKVEKIDDFFAMEQKLTANEAASEDHG